VGELPFGELLYDVALEAWREWRAAVKDDEMRSELQNIAQQASDEVKRIAKVVSDKAAANQSEEVRKALQAYLALIPSSIRQNLKRPADPTGTTVPDNLRLDKPEDLLLLLPPQPPRFEPGSQPKALGGWQLIDLLGTGGFGEVWLAQNVSLPEMRAAIKFCFDAVAQNRFLLHEGKLVQRVMKAQRLFKTLENGDGIVPLHDANLTADPPWLRYEYIEGTDLVGLLRSWEKLSGEERAKRAAITVRRLATVVGQFHRLPEPIVHRDLKPANVLVQRGAGGKMMLRICDFGISQLAANQSLELARRSTANRSLAPTLRGAHTPLYASPQQKLMKDPDVRDDVYALGVIWFQLMMGDVSLERPAGKWRKRIATSEVPDDLLDLLESCIDDDPNERPKDADELATLLRERATRTRENEPAKGAVMVIEEHSLAKKPVTQKSKEPALPGPVKLEIVFHGDDSFGVVRDDMLVFCPTVGRKVKVFFDGKLLSQHTYVKKGFNLSVDTFTGDHELLITWHMTMINLVADRESKLPGEARIKFTLERKGNATLMLGCPAERSIAFDSLNYS